MPLRHFAGEGIKWRNYAVILCFIVFYRAFLGLFIALATATFTSLDGYSYSHIRLINSLNLYLLTSEGANFNKFFLNSYFLSLGVFQAFQTVRCFSFSLGVNMYLLSSKIISLLQQVCNQNFKTIVFLCYDALDMNYKDAQKV